MPARTVRSTSAVPARRGGLDRERTDLSPHETFQHPFTAVIEVALHRLASRRRISACDRLHHLLVFGPCGGLERRGVETEGDQPGDLIEAMAHHVDEDR